jgi:hypothetical protein
LNAIAWFDFRVRAPSSAWTRQELHEQVVEVEREMRERAIKGEFSPEKLVSLRFARICFFHVTELQLSHSALLPQQDLKRQMQPRSDLTDEDMYYAKKHGWGRIHPGIDEDEDDEDDD